MLTCEYTRLECLFLPDSIQVFEPVAQLVEHLIFNLVVAGSSPARLTTFPPGNISIRNGSTHIMGAGRPLTDFKNTIP